MALNPEDITEILAKGPDSSYKAMTTITGVDWRPVLEKTSLTKGQIHLICSLCDGLLASVSRASERKSAAASLETQAQDEQTQKHIVGIIVLVLQDMLRPFGGAAVSGAQANPTKSVFTLLDCLTEEEDTQAALRKALAAQCNILHGQDALLKLLKQISPDNEHACLASAREILVVILQAKLDEIAVMPDLPDRTMVLRDSVQNSDWREDDEAEIFLQEVVRAFARGGDQGLSIVSSILGRMEVVAKDGDSDETRFKKQITKFMQTRARKGQEFSEIMQQSGMNECLLSDISLTELLTSIIRGASGMAEEDGFSALQRGCVDSFKQFNAITSDEVRGLLEMTEKFSADQIQYIVTEFESNKSFTGSFVAKIDQLACMSFTPTMFDRLLKEVELEALRNTLPALTEAASSISSDLAGVLKEDNLLEILGSQRQYLIQMLNALKAHQSPYFPWSENIDKIRHDVRKFRILKSCTQVGATLCSPKDALGVLASASASNDEQAALDIQFLISECPEDQVDINTLFGTVDEPKTALDLCVAGSRIAQCLEALGCRRAISLGDSQVLLGEGAVADFAGAGGATEGHAMVQGGGGASLCGSRAEVVSCSPAAVLDALPLQHYFFLVVEDYIQAQGAKKSWALGRSVSLGGKKKAEMAQAWLDAAREKHQFSPDHSPELTALKTLKVTVNKDSQMTLDEIVKNGAHLGLISGTSIATFLKIAKEKMQLPATIVPKDAAVHFGAL
jgi:hypothetical protein